MYRTEVTISIHSIEILDWCEESSAYYVMLLKKFCKSDPITNESLFGVEASLLLCLDNSFL